MYIVYQHKRNDDNSIFYVGIGKTYNRAYSKSGRNKYWHNIVNKFGYTVDILYHDCDEFRAKQIEKELIAILGKSCNKTGKLCNITDGGDDSVTTKNRICINKDNKERFIYENEYEEYKKSGWNRGRSHKTKQNIGKANSVSLSGRKMPEEVKQKLRGKRDPYKLTEEVKNKIIELYQNYTIEEICSKTNLSFPLILNFLKQVNLYTKKRKIKTCPHCKFTGSGPNMTRYHFNNCKLKPVE